MNERKLISFLTCLLLAIPCAARTITIDDNGPADFDNIQAAIDDSNDGDIIEVQPGTYTGDSNRDIDFGGRAITVRSIDPNDPSVVATTIIDCNGTEAEPHRGFYFHSEEESNSVLDGLTISGGYGPQEQILGEGETSTGGAIFCKNSSPRIANCIIKDNFAVFGGGVYFDGSSSTLTNCTFSCNRVVGMGGGMHNAESNPTLINCTFSANLAEQKGGGMLNYQSNPMLTSCTFSSNYGGGGGGGMTNYDGSSPTLTNCAFTGNSAPMVLLTGGGGGGMYNFFGSNPTLINCTFSGNWAGGEGGGMSNVSSNPILVNCTFYKNLGLADRNGIVNWWADTCPTLRNCILWDGGNEIWNRYGSAIMISYSDVQGGWPGLGNIDIDPYFVEPGYWADANDPNIVVEPNDPNAVWVEGNYHLLPGSPCIDAGDNNSVPADANDLDGDGNTTEPIPFDFDGELRFVDDPCTPDTGNGVPPIVDMGAFEFQLPDPVELLLDLMEKVVDLNLHHGIANSLSAKMDAALKLLEDDNQNNDVAAINLLQAFINAVEAQRGKKIPEAEADALIAKALEIIDLLSAE